MKDLYALTGQALAGMAVELVDVERAAAGLLRVTIDRADGVRIEDCEAVSRQLSRVFEVENINYQRLEVGSPGVDRPLKSEADLHRFAGARVEVKLREALAGRKVFVGLLSVVEDNGFGLDYETDQGEPQRLNFTFDEVERAKLAPVLDFKGKKR